MQRIEGIPQAGLSHVTDKALAKANADHHFRGWCCLESLVPDWTRIELLQEAISADYVTIFNRLGQRDVVKDSRSAAKVGARGKQVLADIVGILRRGLIIGDEHVDGMGRGGTYLQTPPRCVKQTQHLDFDFVKLRRPGRRCTPMPCQQFFLNGSPNYREVPVSIWVALQDSSLYFEDVKHHFKAGDVVVFAGDTHHAGAESASETESHYRLFAYVPTRRIRVPWEVKTGMAELARSHEVTDSREISELHSKTFPDSDVFEPELFQRHLFDAAKCKFYRFHMGLWLSGLTTNTSDKHYYRPYVNGAPDIQDRQGVGKCPHFDCRDFNANKKEKALLNNFRRQCKQGIYCQGRTKKRQRAEDA